MKFLLVIITLMMSFQIYANTVKVQCSDERLSIMLCNYVGKKNCINSVQPINIVENSVYNAHMNPNSQKNGFYTVSILQSGDTIKTFYLPVDKCIVIFEKY